MPVKKRHLGIYLTASVFVLCLLLSGCAGPGLRVLTSVPNATVDIKHGPGEGKPIALNQAGVYPMPFSQSAVEKVLVTVKAPGYQTFTMTLTQKEFNALKTSTDGAAKELPTELKRSERKVMVRVTADPADSVVAITKSDGTKVLAEQKAPAEKELMFFEDKPAEGYKVRVSRNRYTEQEEELTLSRVEKLPQDSSGTKELLVRLASTEYVDTEHAAIFYDDQKGLLGRVRKVRAYKDPTDQTGRNVEMIYTFPDPHLAVRGLAVSLDGKRIAFAQAEFETASPSAAAKPGEADSSLIIKSCNIMEFNIADTGPDKQPELHPLTEKGFRDVDPFYALMPDQDGKLCEHLLFASNRRVQTSADVWQRSLSGSVISTPIYKDDDDWAALSPSWGSKLMAFVVHPMQVNAKKTILPKVWTRLGTGSMDRVTKAEQPRISPDGKKIVYIDPEDRNLYVVELKEEGRGAPRRLTSKAHDIALALENQMSPDERALLKQHPELFAPYSNPTWTKNSDYIVYNSLEGADSSTGRPNEDIWMISVTGGDPKQLTANGSCDIFPVVDPFDGKSIFFISNRGEKKTWSIYRIVNPLAIQ